LFSKDSRFRQRTLSRFDSRTRKFVRILERRIKFFLSSPLGALLRPRRGKTPVSPEQVSGILILRYDALGDAVLTTPVWRTLKRLAPHIRIGVAGSRRNKMLLEADPDIDNVFIFSKDLSAPLLKELSRARKIKWDFVLNLYFHDKTRAAIFSKIVAPQGLSVTIVREKKEKYLDLYSVVGDRPPLPAPMVEQNIQVLKETIDLPIEPEDLRPSLPEYPEIRASFQPHLDTILQSSESFDYFIINTDASQIYKEWGIRNSLALARKMRNAWPRRHIFLSSAPERAPAVRDALRPVESGITYLETPSILHLAVAVRGARAVISPDTSVIHFATAQNVPVVGLYMEPNEFLPYRSANRVLYAPEGQTAAAISVNDVFEALCDLLHETGP